jgi:hypothetical protein
MKKTLEPEVLDLSKITMAPLSGNSFETFANFFIVEAVVALDRRRDEIDGAAAEIFGKRHLIEKAEICFTINGVQVPFLDVLHMFYQQWDRIVKANAVEMVQNKFSHSTADIFNLLDDLKRRLEKAVGTSEERQGGDECL